MFLLDDHEVVRRGVRELLEAEDDLEVVGEAGTAEEAYGRIPATTPDVAILDVRLPDGDGVEVCREIRSKHPEIACLMLTSFADDEALFSAIMAGAAGYVLKQVRGTDLVDGVRRVGRGESLLDPLVDRPGCSSGCASHRQPDELAGLTDQERRILDLIAEGLTNRQIGEQLFLAEKTVKNYVSNLLAKLGMSRRTEAAAYAARLSERRAAPRSPALSERRLPSAARRGVRGEGARPSLGTIGFAGEEVVLAVDDEALGVGGEPIAETPPVVWRSLSRPGR